MAEIRVDVGDGTYTIAYDGGNVSILKNGQPWLNNPPSGQFIVRFAQEIEFARALLRKYMQVVITEGGKSWVRSTNWADGRLTNDEHARLIAIAQQLGATDAF